MNATVRMSNVAIALRPYVDGDDIRAPVVDLLADLQHYCASLGMDFESALSVARHHFEVEKCDDDE